MVSARRGAFGALFVVLWLGLGCQAPEENGPAAAAMDTASPPQGGNTAVAQPAPAATAGTAAPPASNEAGSAAPPPPPAMEPAVVRPEGWEDASHARGATPDYERLFSDDRVHRIDIEMSAETAQTMRADLEMLLGGSNGGFPSFMPGGGPPDLVGGDPVFVPVTVSYDGRVWTQVGMRFKGNSSLATAFRTDVRKLGFRLDFDQYEDEHPETLDQRFFGFGKMTFASGFRDPSLLRDKLASELLNAMGLVAARAAFYRVYVDAGAGPEYWGLYTMLEDPGDQLAEAQFADDSGNMYKPDGAGARFTTFDEESFAKKSNEEAADYSDVMAAIAALNAPRDDAQAWRAGLEAVFDVESFLGVLALSRAIGHWDGYGVMAHNYYLYGDPSDGNRLVWISWDHNLAWQNGFGPFGSLSPMMDEVGSDWPLIRFLLDDPVYRAQYVDALRAATGGSYEKVAFDARAEQLHALIAPFVVGEDGEQAPFTFLASHDAFRNALSDPVLGLIATADALREAARAAIGP